MVRSRPLYADQGRSSEPQRPCDSEGCGEAGLFRAPKDRQQLSSYWWFCLEHVRAYNASWDFYRGMSAEQIEAEVRRDTTWQRPTWRFGQMPGRTTSRRFRDPFHVMGEGEGEAPPRGRHGAYSPEQQAALAVFDLDAPVPLADLKQRYKILVKRHHPDANGGSKEAEERLKVINAAYRTLRTQAPPGP